MPENRELRAHVTALLAVTARVEQARVDGTDWTDDIAEMERIIDATLALDGVTPKHAMQVLAIGSATAIGPVIRAYGGNPVQALEAFEFGGLSDYK